MPDPTTLAEGYPPALADALVRALARDPDDRWQTAAELRDALDAYVESTGGRVDAVERARSRRRSLFADAQPAAWERLADEATADQERTPVWEERKDGARTRARRPAVLRGPSTGRGCRLGCSRSAGRAPLSGTLVAGLIARGCRGSERPGSSSSASLGSRACSGSRTPGPRRRGSAATPPRRRPRVRDDDRSAPCALAKIAGYQAWQDALAKAKVNAAPAEAACADIWSDTKKQACYRAAMAQIRATQAARDAVIAGGAAAREAVRAVEGRPEERRHRARARGEPGRVRRVRRRRRANLGTGLLSGHPRGDRAGRERTKRPARCQAAGGRPRRASTPAR